MRMRIGDQFERLTVIALLPERRARCRCICGKEVIVWRNNLPRGNTRSCGCLHREMSKQMPRTHGWFHAFRTEYRSWVMMKNRCLNTRARNYAYYGARGIIICEEWRYSFAAFMRDMGPRPGLEYSIERRDNNGHY